MSLLLSYAASRPAVCRREAAPWVALVPGYAAFRKLLGKNVVMGFCLLSVMPVVQRAAAMPVTSPAGRYPR